jgi:hypothetical protein
MSYPQVTKKILGRVDFVCAWYDFWIGLYWNREKRWLYILPVPCLGICIRFGRDRAGETFSLPDDF